MTEQKKTEVATSEHNSAPPAPEDGQQQLFVHAIAMRPDLDGRKRPVLIVGFAPPR